MKANIALVLKEIERCLDTSDYSDVDDFVCRIESANVILCYGAGRVGYAMKGFAKRLAHLGKLSYFLEDTTIPRTGAGDLLIVGSGSGSTPSVLTMAEIARNWSLDVILITAKRDSALSEMSSSTIYLNAPSKDSRGTSTVHSKQPMTTLFEQSIGIFCDSLVLSLMQRMAETDCSMKARHNAIE